MQLKVENFLGLTLFSLIMGERSLAAATVKASEIPQILDAIKKNASWMQNDEIAIIPIRVGSSTAYAAQYSILIGAEQTFVATEVLKAAVNHAINRNDDPLIIGGVFSDA
jgi:hypothetical protein